jgi:hypothetical protein
MKFQILNSTKNSGQYVAGKIAPSLSAAKAIIRAERAGRKTFWRQEGDDIAAYASPEDMSDEGKAVARVRPAGGIRGKLTA